MTRDNIIAEASGKSGEAYRGFGEDKRSRPC